MGKAMLAFQPPEVIEQIVSKIRFVRYTHKTLTSREALIESPGARASPRIRH